jgi:di/tricarboxylate transporter
MTGDQGAVVAVLAATIGMFLWGRWRHDMVALGSLLACVAAGLVPAGEAFAGFGHPAVVTVACVLVLSRGLQTSGAIDALAQRIIPGAAGPTLTIASLTGLAAVLSAFMNNVGALALLLPIAIQVAARQELPPGKVLMPLAFGSILGGMTTLIGTPPNLIVSGFRAQNGAGSFAMFDFAPVGLAIAAAGIVFVALLGWRLVPARKQADTESFDIGTYLTEARIPERSKLGGKTLREVEATLDEVDAQVVGLIRREVRVPAPNPAQKVWPGDILVVEADPEALAAALSKLGLKLEEDVREKPERKAAGGEGKLVRDETAGEERERANGQGEAAAGTKEDEGGNGATDDGEADEEGEAATEERAEGERAVESGEIALMEAAVMPDSALVGRSASDILLRTRYGINLLAVSRQGRRSITRLRTTPARAGDVLLLQGPPEALAELVGEFGCVPLAKRSLRIPDRRQALIATAVMIVAITGAAFGLVPAAIAFAAGVLVFMALRVVPLRAVYEAIDWPVVVLLGALIPVAGAMASTGAADLLAHLLLERVAQGHAIAGLAVILVVTMTLSDFMNNAATAAVLCPIAIGTAAQLGTSPDPFLMAVAVGASCAFLTPIGHQNNTLILGPGGFRFGDYWRLGLPLEVIVIAVGVPMILLVWPL